MPSVWLSPVCYMLPSSLLSFFLPLESWLQLTHSQDPSATLAPPESLREQKSEATFESDPLFNRTTKLFDENCASGG